MPIKKLSFLIIMFAALNTAGQTQTKIENATAYKAVALKKQDKTFLALLDTAQKHIPEFIHSLESKQKGYRFLIKSDFVENGEHEHMWSEIAEYKDGRFIGIFIDSPFDLKNIKTGDKVNIAKGAVEDWTIFNEKDEQVAGGFSDRYLNSKK
jgi:uncharacterized protein YegJ (DUF2314 family)